MAMCMYYMVRVSRVLVCVFVQAEDGIRSLVRSRGLGDVYKRQDQAAPIKVQVAVDVGLDVGDGARPCAIAGVDICLLYTSDAAAKRASVDLGGRRLIQKKKKQKLTTRHTMKHNKS